MRINQGNGCFYLDDQNSRQKTMEKYVGFLHTEVNWKWLILFTGMRRNVYSSSISEDIYLSMHDKNNSFYKDNICFTYIDKLLLVQRNGADAIIFNISYYPDTLKLKLQSNNLTNNDILKSVLKLQEITFLVQNIKT